MRRMHILDAMLDAVPLFVRKPKSLRPRLIIACRFLPTRFRDVIGSGGKGLSVVFKKIQAHIDIQEDGSILIAGTSGAGEAAERIKLLSKCLKWARSTAVASWAFNLLVLLLNCFLKSKDGLLHVSRVARSC